MAVKSWREILPRTFNHKLGSAPTAQMKYKLTLDGPTPHQVILNTVGILHGTAHPEYGYLWCSNGQITEPDYYHAEVTYDFELPPTGTDTWNPNPLLRPDIWSYSTGGSSVPATHYWEGTQKKPLVNSAGDPLFGVSTTVGELKVSIKGNRPFFDFGLATAVTGTINSAAYLGAPEYHWLCQGISGTPKVEAVNGTEVKYYEVTANLVYRQNGYLAELYDVGMNYLDPTSGERCRARVFSEERGVFVAATQPVALNIDGSQKDPGLEPDVLERRLHVATDFLAFFGVP